jgi:ankyrin repeat protein
MILQHYDLDSLPPLHRAAGAGDLGELARLLDAGVDIDARADTRMGKYARKAEQRALTPLMVAAGSAGGTADAVRALLKRGANPRACSEAGVDALWYAAGTGDPERVEALLALGGDPHAVSTDERSVVAVAARTGRAETVRRLLREGASPHPPAGLAGYAGVPGNAIPLFAAAMAGSADCVRMLLDHGADAGAQDNAGQTALMHASTPEVIPILLAAGCPRDARDTYGRSALDKALLDRQAAVQAAMRDAPDLSDMRVLEPDIQRRQTALVAALLDAGIDSEGRDAQGRTALLGYCLQADVAPTLVELLIARGSDVLARDPEGRTALHMAAWNHIYPQALGDVVRLLVGVGIPVDARDNQGRTPLHLAIAKEFGGRTVIALLLDLGADIEARDADGLTPLLLATSVQHQSHAIVRLLLGRGADLSARTPGGHTARDLAAAHAARLEQQLVSPDQAPDESAQLSAERRLALRGSHVTMEELDATDHGTPAAEPPTLPEPIWLGYRLLPRRASLPEWTDNIEASQIAEICSYGHASCIGEENAAACYPTEEAAAEWFMVEKDGQPAETYAYRAFPLLFETSGAPRPIAPADLLGEDAPAVQPPELGRFERLGYDVTECALSRWSWTGCSPLSPYCNGMAFGMSALVNRYCLVDDLGAAYDFAVIYGVTQPEPGPYLIVEVWRRVAEIEGFA